MSATLDATVLFAEIARVSQAGTAINEDACGVAGALAWVIDGATPSGSGRTPGPSDAAWLAAAISAYLARCDTSQTLDAILSGLQSALAEAFDAVTPDQDASGPSACLALLRVGERLEGAVIGDVAVLVPTAAGIARWTDERVAPVEARTIALLAEPRGAGGALTDAVRQQMAANRATQNQPGGFWVVHPRKPWVHEVLRFSAPVPDGPILLATDGFLRLVDGFALYQDADLLAQTDRLAALVEELRREEEADATCVRMRRVKQHDDATALAVHCFERRGDA